MLKTSAAPNVETMIRSYIAENILFSKNGYPYPDDTSFLEGGIVDSTNVLELVMFVEENFGISVQDQDILPDPSGKEGVRVVWSLGLVHTKKPCWYNTFWKTVQIGFPAKLRSSAGNNA
jgi:acyl carrier protein